MWQGQATNLSQQAGTRKYLATLLEKWLKWLINRRNSCQFPFFELALRWVNFKIWWPHKQTQEGWAWFMFYLDPPKAQTHWKQSLTRINYSLLTAANPSKTVLSSSFSVFVSSEVARLTNWCTEVKDSMFGRLQAAELCNTSENELLRWAVVYQNVFSQVSVRGFEWDEVRR